MSGERLRRALIVDFGGVLTTNVFESFRDFCEAEGLEPDAVKRIFRERGEGLNLLRQLERGEIAVDEFSARFGPLLGVRETDGMVERLFAGVQADDRMVEASATIAGGPSHRRTLRLRPRSRARVLGEALCLQGRDPVYEQALAAAIDLT